MATDNGPEPCSELTIRFSPNVYELETIQRAAYQFTDRFSFDFSTQDGAIVCQLTSMGATLDTADFNAIEGEFKNAVLDQHLRRSIADETAAVRNAILAYAFSRTGLQDVE